MVLQCEALQVVVGFPRAELKVKGMQLMSKAPRRFQGLCKTAVVHHPMAAKQEQATGQPGLGESKGAGEGGWEERAAGAHAAYRSLQGACCHATVKPL